MDERFEIEVAEFEAGLLDSEISACRFPAVTRMCQKIVKVTLILSVLGWLWLLFS